MRNVLSRVTLTLLLFALVAECTRQGVAAWLSSFRTPDAAQMAERLDRGNPNLYVLRSAIESNSTQVDSTFSVNELEAATRTGPNRALNWALLAEAYDSAAKTPMADAAFQRALELFPRSPKINWMYANFLIRSGDSTRAFAPLKIAMDGDQDVMEGAFDLAWRARLSPEKILAAIPVRSNTLSAYLDFLARTNRLSDASIVWQRLQAVSAKPDLGASFHYFDSLFYSHNLDSMLAVWSVLLQDYPDRLPKPADAQNLISNGSFEIPPSNGGFDWRLVPVEGARVFVDSTAHQGSHSLCAMFDGTRNLQFNHVVQYVPVKPNMDYQFSAWLRAKDVTTDSGPRIAIYDAFDPKQLSVETPNLLGTFDWNEQTLRFSTGPATTLLVVQLLRPASQKLDNKLSGTVWLDSVNLSVKPINRGLLRNKR